MTTICHELFQEVTIHANGNVVCSCMDPCENHIFGNVNKLPIYHIFHGPEYAAMRKSILSSGNDSYCSDYGIQCPFKGVDSAEHAGVAPEDLRIRKIRLETISHCNLRCPVCAVTDWYAEQAAKNEGVLDRFARLPLEVSMAVIYDTRSTLEHLWLYNYGEPFLDKDLLNLCRYAKRQAPNVEIFTHTNATVLPDGWAEAIAKEGLFRHMSFSIDGVHQESYEKYRVRGKVDTALGILREFAKQRDLHSSREQLGLVWQYILFEWNDSPEELAEAQQIADEIGVDMQWIITHTEGKSKRILAGSPEYEALNGIHHYSGQLLAEQFDEHEKEAQLDEAHA